MRLPTKALLLGLVILPASHLIAIITESQAVAQLSWLLIFTVIGVALLALVDEIVHRIRRKDTS